MKACFGLAAAAVLMTMILFPASALAITGGRLTNVPVGTMADFKLLALAGRTYTITTRNLTPSTADTVLHVQNDDDPNGGYIGGNDDYSGGGLASQVVVASAATNRNLHIIARSFATSTGGSGELVIAGSDGSNVVYPIAFGNSSPQQISTGLIATSHVMTVEQQGGANDTLLLVLANGSTHAIAYDDDDGTETMSWVHINDPCPAGACYVVIGSRAGTATGPTTMIWDEGAHAASSCDTDAMSDVLELAIGTDPCNNDTDGDGLSDSSEVLGIAESPGMPAVKLPTWGADPLKKDLFVELDWTESTPPDSNQVQPANAIGIASYYAPDVVVHLDTGVANTDPSTRNTYGNWGGATRIPNGTSFCQTLTPSRLGLFHHGIISGSDGAGSSDSLHGGYCFFAGNNSNPPGSTIAHELGHNFELSHGGAPNEDIACKPQYYSIMNYLYLYNTTAKFSRNEHSSPLLNPAALDESVGIGAANSFIPADGFSISGTAVDWNRDGVFAASGSTVVASPTWSTKPGTGGCYQSGISRWDLVYGYGPGSGWVRPPSGVARYYVVSRTSDGSLQYRSTTGAGIQNCRNQFGDYFCAPWLPDLYVNPTAMPVNYLGTSGVAVARLTYPDNTDRLAVVATDGSNKLRLHQMTLAANGSESWSTSYVGSGTDVVQGDPAAIVYNGKLEVFAIVAGKLSRWEFTPSSGTTGTWTGPSNQIWADNTQIGVDLGVGVTVGYETTVTGPQLYGAFALTNAGAMKTIAIARYSTATGKWTQLSSIWGGASAATNVHPGIVYVPTSSADVTRGRFYLAWNDSELRITLTSGNDSAAGATTKRLIFGPGVDFINVWAAAHSGVTLSYDLSFDVNPRGTFTHVDDYANLAPFVDGIINFNMHDNNDYAYITQNLGCSLTRTCP